MAKKILLFMTAIVILGGIYFFSTRNSESNQPIPNRNTTSGNEVSIIYSDSGYAPKVVTVKSGTIIKFLNQSSNPMWTASDPHPTHTTMHDFDAMRAMMKDESYSFTFTEPGTWRYHNHMVPGHMGSVIVE